MCVSVIRSNEMYKQYNYSFTISTILLIYILPVNICCVSHDNHKSTWNDSMNTR